MLVERKQHMSRFEDALTRCAEGVGTSVAIVGPLASGKSSLVRRFTDRATEEGFLVLKGTGTRTERRLPLGLVDQFCHGSPVLRQVAHSHFAHSYRASEEFATVPHELADRWLAQLLHTTAAALHQVSEQRPVLVAVDDLHHADPISLRCLLYLTRRIDQSRIITLLCGRDLSEPTDPLLYAELIDQAPGGPLRVPALSSVAVRDLLTRRLPDASPALVASCKAATGGNPLLVQALATDLAGLPDSRAKVDRGGQVAAGAEYARAVHRCLDRCDPEAQRVLRASAILDVELPAGIMPLARLSALDSATVERSASVLAAAGLLRSGRLPHPRARQAVLDGMPAPEVAQLHLRAARLLYDEGATPVSVARHLVRTGGDLDPWAVPVLREAAEQLLGEPGESALAIRLLRLAHAISGDPEERAALRAILLQIEWRADPAQARHRLPQLGAMAREGTLSLPHGILAVHGMLWFGQVREARAVLDRLAARAVDDDQQAEIRFAQVWANLAYPGSVGRPAADLDAPGRRPRDRTSTREVLACVLETVLNKAPGNQAVTAAEQFLQQCTLGDATLAPIAASLGILVHADHLETAALWCDRLLAQAAEHEAPTWQAVLGSVRAKVSLRQGRMLDAQRHAEAALARMSVESWATSLGAPLATLIQAMTSRGMIEEAAAHLDQPVPEETFQTIWGLEYLQARGRYYLAAGRPDAALDDFLTCGDLMDRWNIDLPDIVAWRLDAARAHLDLGDTDQARNLIEVQVAQLGSVPNRPMGLAHRLLAAISPVAQRIALLRESAAMLRRVGDDLELAYTLADLSRAYQVAGDSTRARVTVRRAWQLATDCHADALRRVLLPDFDEADAAEPQPTVDTATLNALSEAERRVAALAAQGDTNRQIANKLFVTVSTVEQHLTRVYRKIGVTRRNDLPAKLPAEFSEIS